MEGTREDAIKMTPVQVLKSQQGLVCGSRTGRTWCFWWRWWHRQGLAVDSRKSGQRSIAMDHKTEATSWRGAADQAGGAGLCLEIQNGVWKVSELTPDNWKGTWWSQKEVSLLDSGQRRDPREKEPHCRWGNESSVLRESQQKILGI